MSSTTSSSSSSSSDNQARNVRDFLISRVGFVPKDAFGWLYACRGLYELREYSLVIEGLAHCIRNEKTQKEAQHLLGFSLLHSKQTKLAAHAFYQSIKLGNDTDWQPLIELCLEQPKLKLGSNQVNGATTTATTTAMTGTGTGTGAGAGTQQQE